MATAASTQLQTREGMVRVPAGSWTVDPVHSSVGFAIKHLAISTVRGRFSEFEGTLEAAPDDPAHSHARGSCQVASVDTGNADRDAHLRGEDFFAADQYPTMSFETTAIEHVEGGTYRVSVDLTIRGTTLSREFEAHVEGAAEDPWGNQRVGIEIRGEINRRDFGLDFEHGKLVGDKVKIEVDISAVQAN